ncbi:MAG: DUF58 domain-containing protein [Lachnospiraceae bacterium]|nr:DUF58 domain-containing protein [Lachnospiraceae bacterium]
MKNKVIYGFIILVTLIGCLFSETDLLSFLLAYELVLIPVLYLLADRLKNKVTSEIQVPIEYVEKNEEFVAEVHLNNKTFLPMPSVKVKISCEDEFTKETFEVEEKAMINAKSSSVLQFYLKALYCGKIRISIKEIRVQDYLCLFSRNAIVKKQAGKVMILPSIHKINLRTAAYRDNRQEGEEYSKARRGEDTSEVFDVHPYRPGDLFQRMHWKLTAKTEEYLVKEYSMPVEENVILFLDLYYEKTEKFTQEQLDCFLEILASLSWSMVEQGWKHKVVWYDGKEGRLKETEITKEQGVYAMLEKIFNAGIYNENKNIYDYYPKQTRQAEVEKSFLLDVTGRFFRDGILEKQFRQQNLEKDLIEWKLEI